MRFRRSGGPAERRAGREEAGRGVLRKGRERGSGAEWCEERGVAGRHRVESGRAPARTGERAGGE